MIVQNSATSRPTLSAVSAGMLVIWHAIVPTANVAQTLAMRHLAFLVVLNAVSLVAMQSTERWRTLCKNFQATLPTVRVQLVTSKVLKVATIQAMEVVPRKILGIDQRLVQEQVQPLGLETDRNVVVTIKVVQHLLHGHNSRATTDMLPMLLHRLHRTTVMVVTSKVMIKMATGLLLRHLLA